MSSKALESDGKVDKTKYNKWKSLILAITDRDEIEAIQKLCSARLDMARAARDIAKVGKPEKKDKNGKPVPDYEDSYRAPKEMEPVVSATEPENMDEIG